MKYLGEDEPHEDPCMDSMSAYDAANAVADNDPTETPKQEAHWAACHAAALKGYQLFYVYMAQYVSLNGKPIPEKWLIRDTDDAENNCGGDSMIIDVAVNLSDFDVTWAPE